MLLFICLHLTMAKLRGRGQQVPLCSVLFMQQEMSEAHHSSLRSKAREGHCNPLPPPPLHVKKQRTREGAYQASPSSSFSCRYKIREPGRGIAAAPALALPRPLPFLAPVQNQQTREGHHVWNSKKGHACNKPCSSIFIQSE
jgi:hypothetical protein